MEIFADLTTILFILLICSLFVVGIRLESLKINSPFASYILMLLTSLGIARPRGAVLEIEKDLLQSKIDLDALQDFRIQLSGCPNSCGNHFTANLGFFGKIQRQGGIPYPAYNVVAGGVVEEGKTRFAKKITQIAAFYLPEFVYKVLTRFLEVKKQFKTFEAWVDSSGEEEIIKIAESFAKIPEFAENPKPYYDWSSEELFSVSLKKNGIGEEN